MRSKNIIFKDFNSLYEVHFVGVKMPKFKKVAETKRTK